MVNLHRVVLCWSPIEIVSMVAMVVETWDTHTARAHCCGGIARHKRGIRDSCALSVEAPFFCVRDIQQRRNQEKGAHAGGEKGSE